MVNKQYLADKIIKRIMEGDAIRYTACPLAGKLLLIFADKRSLIATQFVEPNYNRAEIEKYCEWNKNLLIQHAEKYIKCYIQNKEYAMPELDLSGYTEQEQIVYRQLLKVPSGKTISYNELAHKAGFPNAARFIGNAMAKNRLPFFVPCHRVIQSSGATGNYTGGVEIKKYLLQHENSG